MPSYFQVDSPTTGLPVYSVDGDGNTIQSGSVTSGDGVVFTETPAPSNPSAGDLKAYSPDGTSLHLLTSTGADSTLTTNNSAQTTGWLNVKSFGAKGNGTSDDTAAIQAALNAIPQSPTTSGGVVYFPSGRYLVSAPLTITYQGTKLLGDKSDTSGFGSHSNFQTTILASSGFVGSAIVDCSVGGFAMQYLTVRGGNIPSGTTSCIRIHGGNANLENVLADSPPGDGIAVASGTTWVAFQHVMATGAGHNTGVGNGFNIAIADSWYTNCIANACQTSGWLISNGDNSTFTACRAEDGAGYGFHFNGTNLLGAISFNQCTTDLNNSHGFFFDGASSQGCIQLNGCEFRRDGNNASAGSKSLAGINVSGTTATIIIDGTSVQARRGDSGGTDSPYYAVRMTSSSNVMINGGYYSCELGGAVFSSDGAGTFNIGPNIPTATVLNSAATVTNNTTWGSYNAGALDQGLIAWAYDPAFAVNSTTVTNGVLYLIKVWLRNPAQISKAYAAITTAATSPVSGQNFMGLYASTGSLLASTVSGAIDASTATPNAVIAGTFGTPYIAVPGFYWVGLLFNASTAPTLVRTGIASASFIPNVQTTNATARFTTNGSGLIGLPSSITPASNGGSPNNYWAALS